MQQTKNDKPILFKTPMVQAVKEDRKDITRRRNGLKEINEAPNYWYLRQKFNTGVEFRSDWKGKNVDIMYPYGPAGTILWVRETFWSGFELDEKDRVDETKPLTIYRADTSDARPFNVSDDWCINEYGHDKRDWLSWRPSIHMPKSAARIWLKVISTRAERLHDITEEDCIREGVEFIATERVSGYKYYLGNPNQVNLLDTAKDSFKSLWVSINGQESWDANPWVFRVEFEVLSTTGKPDNV